MAVTSVLFLTPEDRTRAVSDQPPAYFHDLNLDQLIDAIVAGKENQYLRPLYYSPLSTKHAVEYRQDTMRDLLSRELLEQIKRFNERFRGVRRDLERWEKRSNVYERQRWFLQAVNDYCVAVAELESDLRQRRVLSQGLQEFFAFLKDYVHSDSFQSLRAATSQLIAELGSVQYSILLQGNRITVGPYNAETDYGAEIEQTFAKFKQGAVKDYRTETASWPDMNHVEEAILDKVVQLYPETFARLAEYCQANASFLNETIVLFEREIRFYTVYLDFIAPLQRAGLNFCLPGINQDRSTVCCVEAFDMALAFRLNAEGRKVVCNDFSLKGHERILVVSGPNQGGKTTFARAFGQIHHLATVGCSVPASSASIVLFDRIFTHFEKEENLEDLRGKLQDDLLRIREILLQATERSILLINEIFTSTTASDALVLSRNILDRITDLGLVCVWVTFIDELASASDATMSMVGQVNPANPSERTYRILRSPANGLAYARAIAEKYRLTYEQLKERIPS